MLHSESSRSTCPWDLQWPTRTQANAPNTPWNARCFNSRTESLLSQTKCHSSKSEAILGFTGYVFTFWISTIFFLYLNFYFKNRSTKKPKEPNFGVPSTLNVKSTQLFLTKNLILGRRTRFLWVRLGRTRTRIWFLGSRTSPQGSRTHAT